MSQKAFLPISHFYEKKKNDSILSFISLHYWVWMTYFDIWSQTRGKTPVREGMTETADGTRLLRGKVRQRPAVTSHSPLNQRFLVNRKMREKL